MGCDEDKDKSGDVQMPRQMVAQDEMVSPEMQTRAIIQSAPAASPAPPEVSKIPPAAAASAVRETEPAPAAVVDQQSSTFNVAIQKLGPDDKLGMDVKHIDGKLEVVHIFPDGAIARSNLENQRKPSGETLQLGDVIHRVNNVDSGDHQMVAECRLTSELTLMVFRAG